ncbi:alpha,alpha-trehalose-phosphate synthase (UDP-forming) [Microvirga terrestris]|uniref:Trehalose-6-phosphate synthase n=1 Tax=Microvirga terrestris TaxID=2791024 RepID=A0ABS0HN97_9HYPH|nr:alpha,alpha-trehalose-phosphate synthase (UDP-forming) [Microvirga terrestris]MBF9194937.1 alpha,alpha-trehalose-phosphate synthase (UDP-forming) [Microvirga terrestris]
MADIPDITREAQDRAIPAPLESRVDAPGSPPDKAKRPLGSVRSKKQPSSSHQQRLVVVSNRVPVRRDGASKAGGLTVALEGALKRSGGLWFGWSGETVDNPSDQAKVSQAGNITFAVLDLSQQDYDEYYAGFANRALWPVCHYRLDLVQIERQELDGYFRVNRAFAASLAPLLRPDDVIWVHDYHFIPLAAELRRLGFKNRIGFFLHIPWPPSDVASALPAYQQLLQGFGAYDLVGFHTPQDAENFQRCLIRENIGSPIGTGEHQIENHKVRIGAFPVGIDTETFVRAAANAERNALVRRTKASLGDRDLIIGVDRLDYSKGLKQRIEAFSCFVKSNPDFRNRVTYIQITPKSRSDVPEYQRMQREIAEQAGWTNGSLGEVDWTPVRYVNRTVGHAALAGLYRMSRIGLVTPLRDGMNLVAKEFVAAQQPDDPGVLILSRFAGAAHELDGAILVNPYDTEACAAAIAQALRMPLEERRERWDSMMARLRTNTVEAWCQRFLSSLSDASDAGLEPHISTNLEKGRYPFSEVAPA